MKKNGRMAVRSEKTAGRMEQGLKAIIFTVVMVLLLCALPPLKVSGSDKAETEEGEYEHELEMTFLEVLDMRLRNLGYADCGLTLSSIIDTDGSRSYCVQIYHARIRGMDTAEWEKLTADLSDLSIPVEGCRIVFEPVS